MRSPRASAAMILRVLIQSMTNALLLGLALFLMRVLLRSTWAAAIACILITIALYFPTGTSPLIRVFARNANAPDVERCGSSICYFSLWPPGIDGRAVFHEYPASLPRHSKMY
jgi:hypothetical protein